MMTSTDPLRRFLVWNFPLLPQLVERILAMDDRESTVIVVPTLNAGRRLRLALAEAVAESGDGAFFPPRVMTPENFFRAEGDDVATKAETLIAWADVLRAMPLVELNEFFPKANRERTFAWAMAAAKPLMNACEQVAEADRSLADIAELSEEPERWVQLAEIERQVAGKLKSMNKVLPAWAKRKRAREPEMPLGCCRLVIAAVPDPVRLSLRAWQHLAASVAVEVWVHAPEALSEKFDPWGVPDTDYWSAAEIALINGNAAVVVSNHGVQMAERVVANFGRLGSPSNDCAVGVCDADFAASLEGELQSHGWSVFDPNGRAVSACGLMMWLGLLRELLTNRPGFDPAQRFLRMSESASMVAEAGSHSLARALDRLRDEAVPDTLQKAIFAKVRGNAEGGRDQFKKFAEFAQVSLRKLRDALVEMRDSAVCEPLLNLVKSLVDAGYDDGAGGKVIAALVAALEEVHAVEGELNSPTDAMDLLLDLLRGKRVTGDREDAVIDLQGWLELPYESAPNLALIGVHEGVVPENLNEDALLPEGLRRKLGLRDRAQRLARDCYLLSSLSASRHDVGDLQCHVIKTSPGGDARVPSRLLMRCEDDELASRVKHCFKSEENSEASPVWQRGDWLLDFQRKPNPYTAGAKALSPSAIKRYLVCPTRFYLERVLKMNRIDPTKRELAANEFGTLLHTVLETFGADEAIRDSSDAVEIVDYFQAVLDADVDARFGRDLPLPLLVQVDSARERLRKFAMIQAATRGEGWKILEVEKRVVDWEFHGVRLTMTIDRIERNESDGRYRVMDFKTSASAKEPKKVHLEGVKEGDKDLLTEPMEVSDAKGRVKFYKWQDVQLPLYAKWVADHYNGGALTGVVTAYGNLPKAVSKTGISTWEIREDEMASATQWVIEAARRIDARMFWPPGKLTNDMKTYDEFLPLIPDGFEEALTPELVNYLQRS